MRTLRVVLTLVLTMSVGALVCAANEVKETATDGQAQVMVVRIQDLHLTDEQEAKIADIRKECRPKVQEAAKELGALVKEEVEKIRDVLTAEQKEKIQALKEEREERRED